ncbi:MAG: adenine phosphoribosyltransferase [Acidobacteria bacterium]|nr:adenine phosphoribosyltransferase [Acidobacteriota bacterium]
MDELRNSIRDIPDFPKAGILFKDITTLLIDPVMFKKAVDALYDKYKDMKIDKVLGIEARGFIFAPMLAYKLNAGFVPVRKPGKLPAATKSISYDLEYGTDSLEIHEDAIKKGDNIIIIDDLLATGGTAEAVVKLVKELGGNVLGTGFVIELEFLNGRSKLEGTDVFTLVKF